MNPKRLLVIVTLIVALVGSSLPAAATVNWMNHADGVERRQTTQKKMLISFYTDWCSACVKMSQETYTDTQVIDYINRHFIPVRVEHDQETALVRQFRVRGLPVTWFVDADGQQIGSHPGFIEAERLLLILKYIHTDSYRSMTFNNFLKSLPE